MKHPKVIRVRSISKEDLEALQDAGITVILTTKAVTHEIKHRSTKSH